MKILMTGGSGDLGSLVLPKLKAANVEVVVIDPSTPSTPGVSHVRGSILDRALLRRASADVDGIIHAAAWHGIHEVRGDKSAAEFFSLNVHGTHEVLDALRANPNAKLLHISSTSVCETDTIYGKTKLLSEELVRIEERDNGLAALILRPRAFIPASNTSVYEDYLDWLKWFWKGAVHIRDVAQAVVKALFALVKGKSQNVPSMTIDGAYDYSEEALREWDRAGRGTTFSSTYPEYVELAARYGLPIAEKPAILGSEAAERIIGYQATYSLRSALEELSRRKV